MKYWRTPLDLDRTKIPHGTVYIIAERCKGCSFCIEFCPKDILVFSEEFNHKGYHFPEVTKNGDCVNCNLCEMICPDFAIFSLPEEEPEETDEAAGDRPSGEDAAKGEGGNP